MELKNSKTFNNLALAYTGESCARNRYDMLAKLAKKEGYVTLADAIEKIAWNEFQHSRMLFSFIDAAEGKVIDNIEMNIGIPFKQKLRSLVGNLILSSQDENNEATKIYPAFAKTATEEGFTDIAGLFNNIIQVEGCHQSFFEIMYNQLKSGTIYKRKMPMKWKCSDCGYEHTSKEAWDICPLCQAPQGHVMLHIEDGAN